MPLAGMPPITPGSAVSVIRSMNFLLVGDAATPRHADAEVDHAVGLQFQGGAARDDLALRHRHRREPAARGFRRKNAGLYGVDEGLPVIFRLRDHDAVDRTPGIFT